MSWPLRRDAAEAEQKRCVIKSESHHRWDNRRDSGVVTLSWPGGMPPKPSTGIWLSLERGSGRVGGGGVYLTDS